MIISFFGHGSLYGIQDIGKRLKNTIEEILQKEEGPFTFHCGGYGDFDLLSARVLCELKKEGYSFESFYITPYLTNDKRLTDKEFLKCYDGTVYPPIENVPPRFAILARNEWMIEKSDLIVGYVLHSYGGTAKARAYAQKRKK